jgi:hypothetical protein
MRPRVSPASRRRLAARDYLRFGLAGGVFLLVFIPFWNRGPVWVGPRDAFERAMVLQGQDASEELDEAGIDSLFAYVTEELEPSINPVAILRHHVRFRFRRESYPFAIGAGQAGPDTSGARMREFAIYQSRHDVFLIVSPFGFNRVLRAKISAEDLEKTLAPYIRGDHHPLPMP